MAIATSIFTKASSSLNTLALAFQQAGDDPHADRFFRAAADVELASDQLQLCWGGPLNGQAGRQALFLALLRDLKPDAIVETGSFRAITTRWLAENFAGEIHSCELQPMYFHQAERRLQGVTNVVLRRQYSVDFLADLAAGPLRTKSLLFYLDAHWEEDLPLKRELALIFERFANPVVGIDDFRVPGDADYGWDDYGAHGAITVPYLENAAAQPLRYYFPTLPSREETGARRGLCFVTLESDRRLDRVAGLKGGSGPEWNAVLAGDGGHPGSRPVDSADPAGTAAAGGNQSYPAIIETLNDEIDMLRGVCQERLELIERLHAECKRLQELTERQR